MSHGKKTAAGLLGLHAQTALHPGAGTALGVVDLPIQRERHTQWPTIPGSALKGILRDRCREHVASADNLEDEPLAVAQDDDRVKDIESPRKRADWTEKVAALFGPPTAAASEFAGALSVTDARLIAFPVRSLRGVFAWVSCPAAIERLQRDQSLAGHSEAWDLKKIAIEDQHCVSASNSPCALSSGHIVLEEFNFSCLTEHSQSVDKIAAWIAEHFIPTAAEFEFTRQRFCSNFVLLADDDFTHFVRHATEVMARVKLNYETKTVERGALFYQEFLPAESMLYSVVLANPTRVRNRESEDGPTLMRNFEGLFTGQDETVTVLQVGADETTGKGLCTARLSRVGQEASV